MALQKQIHIYSVDTSAFYTEEEQPIHNYMNRLYRLKNKISIFTAKKNHKLSKSKILKYESYITAINKKIKEQKDLLYTVFQKCNTIRHLNKGALTPKNVVSVFESVLTRTLCIPENALVTDIIIVQTYFFDVIEDIILDGFMFNNEKYVVLTASAGQIRTKKTVFIKESIWLENQKTLMCGLTIDEINKLGGVNINKFLAYLALFNSATDHWVNFDIDKSIVVDDMETNVRGIVDFINDETYEIKRQIMDVPITHTDGCGMILPKQSNKNFMVRLPWIKGLLASFPFDKFIDKFSKSKVIDIYGKEWDIIKDDIQIIFTKSQFKMYKYYNNIIDDNGKIIKYGWDIYKDNFKKYSCQAGFCNIEEDNFANAKINYQMLQTLINMTNEELELLAKTTKNDIYNVGRSKKIMLKVLGVTKANTNKNYYQQALELYPQLLRDTYSKEILKQTKKSMVKEARAGKIEIDGRYTFLIPDLYAFCEYLFLNNENPKGLLNKNEVYCKLYKNIHKLDCLRSPHLYREHAVRQNVVDEEKNKWFVTNGLYTSCHDLVSKILQFDNDGDKSLVCADTTLVTVAERHMKDIVPLFYNMKKANAEIVNKHSIYKGLKSAYTGGNIGMISNDITKIWNSDNINLDVVKLLCMENNFTIDYAKTLYKPQRPLKIKELITEYTKAKTPHFFIYAKDKLKNKVEPINNSVVNRLEKIIHNPRILFETANVGEFKYRMLLNGKRIVLDNDIINKYTELDLKKRFVDIKPDEDDTSDNIYIYKDIRDKILMINSDIYYVVDVLVKYLYEQKNSSYKTTLWSSFGDVLVENLRRNVINNTTYCEKCGVLIEQTNNKIKYCKECSREIWKEYNAQKQKEYYYKNKNSV